MQKNHTEFHFSAFFISFKRFINYVSDYFFSYLPFLFFYENYHGYEYFSSPIISAK